MSLLINRLDKSEILNSENFARSADVIFSEVVTKKNFEKIKNNYTKVIEETDLYVFYFLEKFEFYENSIIFTNTYLAKILFTELDKSNFKNIKIITSQTDHLITEELFKCKPKCVSSWYSTNVNYQSSNLIPIPLGLANEYSPKNIKKSDYESLFGVTKKINKLYLNFEDNTNYFHRNKLKRKLKSKNFVTIDTKRIDNIEYLNNLHQHKFILCPWGNGTDSHRIWETLYSDSIPIIPKDYGLAKILGNNSLFFENVSELKDKIAPKEKDEDFKVNEEILNIKYWLKKIQGGDAAETKNNEIANFDCDQVIDSYLKDKFKENKIKKTRTLKRKIHNKVFTI